MIKVIPNKKNIGAEIICDLKKLSKKDLNGCSNTVSCAKAILENLS